MDVRTSDTPRKTPAKPQVNGSGFARGTTTGRKVLLTPKSTSQVTVAPGAKLTPDLLIIGMASSNHSRLFSSISKPRVDKSEVPQINKPMGVSARCNLPESTHSEMM